MSRDLPRGSARRPAPWFAAVSTALVLLAAGCEREPTRTVVLSGGGEHGATAMGAPPAAAAVSQETAPAVASAASGAVAAVPSPQRNGPQAEAPSGPAPVAARGPGDGAGLLAARALAMPVEGVPPSALTDMFDESRGGRRHEAIDILAPRGAKVFAVDDGRVAKLFTSKPGGLTVYQFDPDGRLAYYYAHLDRYADGLREGMALRRGDLVGHVGTSGNAGNTPHLHFAVFRLGPQRRWWEGDPVNPYPALRRARAAG